MRYITHCPDTFGNIGFFPGVKRGYYLMGFDKALQALLVLSCVDVLLSLLCYWPFMNQPTYILADEILALPVTFVGPV